MDPREHQREIMLTVNSAIEELNELQEEVMDLHYEETRFNNLLGVAKELSERLKKLGPQVSTYEEDELISAIETATNCRKT